MKNIFLAFAFLFTAVLFSQQGSIKGTVTDQAMNSEPLLFANVQLQGSDTSYQTNFHGNFEISELTEGDYTLMISYAGYETLQIPISIKNNEVVEINSTMSPMQINFNDVAGIDTASKEEIILITGEEKLPRK